MESIQIIISIILVIPSLCELYTVDTKDMEALSKKHIAQLGYKNSLEDAIPQTDIILNHFNPPLPDGKTEKKVAP